MCRASTARRAARSEIETRRELHDENRPRGKRRPPRAPRASSTRAIPLRGSAASFSSNAATRAQQRRVLAVAHARRPRSRPPGQTCASHDAIVGTVSGADGSSSSMSPAATKAARRFTAVCVAMKPWSDTTTTTVAGSFASARRAELADHRVERFERAYDDATHGPSRCSMPSSAIRCTAMRSGRVLAQHRKREARADLVRLERCRCSRRRTARASPPALEHALRPAQGAQELQILRVAGAPIFGQQKVDGRLAHGNGPVHARARQTCSMRRLPQRRNLMSSAYQIPALAIRLKRIERRVGDDAVLGRRHAGNDRRVTRISDGRDDADDSARIRAVRDEAA